MNQKPLIVMVAPNGAYKTSTDHPALPLTVNKTIQCALDCYQQGATAIHAHVRDSNQQHALDIDQYRVLIEEIPKATGQQMLIQVTSEAAGVFSVEQQISMIKQLKPPAVSIAIRELARADQKTIHELGIFMKENRIFPQWIIYQQEDLDTYINWMKSDVLPGKRYPVLFVFGRDKENAVDEIETILKQYLKQQALIKSWFVCGFNHLEIPVCDAAIKLGGHLRIGFENNLYSNDSNQRAELAQNNASQIQPMMNRARNTRHLTTDYATTLQVFTPDW